MRVLAVPRSMAMSLEMTPNRDENMRGLRGRGRTDRDSGPQTPPSGDLARSHPRAFAALRGALGTRGILCPDDEASSRDLIAAGWACLGASPSRAFRETGATAHGVQSAQRLTPVSPIEAQSRQRLGHRLLLAREEVV